LQKGVSQGSVIGPLICNFVLSNILNDFFNDKQFPMRPKLINIKDNLHFVKATRFIIGYADDLMIKVINVQEANYSYTKIEKLLKTVGLNINKEKSTIYNLLEKSKFDWLGYTFLTVPKNHIYYSTLISRAECFQRFKNRINQGALLLYVSNYNYKNMKINLKNIICSIKHKALLSVLKKVNLILKRIARYFSFECNSKRLYFLRHFVDRCF
jgi:hypothetical protein